MAKVTKRRLFGSIEQLPSKRYRAVYRAHGRKIRSTLTFPTKADAGAWLAKIEAELRGGTWVDPEHGRETLEDYAQRWLSTRTDLADNTRAKYGYLLRLHILPALGKYELARVSATDVRTWYHALADRHRTTANDAYRCLRTIMNTAVTDGHLPKSPCTVKGAGSVTATERPIASVVEVQAATDAIPGRYRAALALAAWCQLRIGEVLALQRRHIEDGKVRIDQAWSKPMGSPRVLKGPKTDAGKRSIGIPANVLPLIEDHLATFVGPQPTDWLFPTSTGTAVSTRNFSREWSKARRKAGRPDLHFHDLRHTGLTWAAASGASLAELMHRGGHANPRAAIRYQHATEDQDTALTKALGQLGGTE